MTRARRGEPVAVLWATEDTIYGQFGYGMASMAAEIDVPRDQTAPFARIDVPGQARLVPLDEAEPLVAPIYERVARVTPGMFARTSGLVAGPGAERHGVEAARRRRSAMRGAGDRRQAGRLCALSDQPGVRARRSTGHIFVVEAMGDTPEATHAIWRFLLDIDWLARVKAHLPAARSSAAAVACRRRAG